MILNNSESNMPKAVWAECEIGKTYFYEPFGSFYKVVVKGLYPEVMEQYGIDRPINSYHMEDDISHAVIIEHTTNGILSAFVVTKTGGI